MDTFVIRIRLTNGMLTEMAFQARSFAEAKGQAQAFGPVLRLIETRSNGS